MNIEYDLILLHEVIRVSWFLLSMAAGLYTQESDPGRSCRSVVAIPHSSLGPYQFHTREDGNREVEVVNEAEKPQNDSSPARALLMTGSSNSLLKQYMQQETKIVILEKKNSDLEKANNGLKRENRSLKEKNKGLEDKVNELEQKIKMLELQAQLTAQSVTVEQGQKESEQGLTYDELQRMNTVKEVTYQTGQESDASSVDEMTGQEPTLAELLSMNSVRD